MVFKTENGREVEIEFYGDYDDVQVDDAYYLDGDEDVSGEDIEYILDRYGAEIDDILRERQMSFSFPEND